MKLRGTLGGLNLLLETGDTPESVEAALQARRELLTERLTVEFSGELDYEVLDGARRVIEAAGGTIARLRAERVQVAGAGAEGTQTVIVAHSLRSGFRGEYKGSVVVLGDVNPGVEVVAGGDVIVMGALRGVVHAGAAGNEEAIIWARPIASPQIRLAGALARAPEENSLSGMKKQETPGHSEMARLQGGQIVIEPYTGR